MDTDDPNLLAAASATELSQMPADYREAFVRAVERTLVHVFGESAQAARESVQAFFAPGEGGPNLFTFHLSPLQIAADLSSARDRELREDELARYLEIQDAEFRFWDLREAKSSGRSSLESPGDHLGAGRRSGAA